MRVIAVIDDPRVTEKILRHLGAWHDPPARPPPQGVRGPYTYEPCDDVDPPPDYEIRKRADRWSHANLRHAWRRAEHGSQRPFPSAPQPSYPAPHSLFRVLGSAHEKPAGSLAKSG